MPIIHTQAAEELFTRGKFWFNNYEDINGFIKSNVGKNIDGNYIVWCRNPVIFPDNQAILLPAGARGTLNVELSRPVQMSEGCIAVYAGKGMVCSRLKSHFKSIEINGVIQRNPHWWLTQIFPDANLDELIRKDFGFSFVENPDQKLKVYVENLSIGIYRPWFNMRLAA